MSGRWYYRREGEFDWRPAPFLSGSERTVFAAIKRLEETSSRCGTIYWVVGCRIFEFIPLGDRDNRLFTFEWRQCEP